MRFGGVRVLLLGAMWDDREHGPRSRICGWEMFNVWGEEGKKGRNGKDEGLFRRGPGPRDWNGLDGFLVDDVHGDDSDRMMMNGCLILHDMLHSMSIHLC